MTFIKKYEIVDKKKAEMNHSNCLQIEFEDV